MMPIVKEIRYHPSLQALQALKLYPGIVFLDSARFDEKLGRYSYMGVDPFLTLTAKNESLFLNQEKVNDNPFLLLKKLLQQYHVPSIDTLPPFQGGAMGYWGYELLHHLEDVPYPKSDTINVPDMKIGFYDVVVVYDHHEKKTWIISHGFPEQAEDARLARAQQRLDQIATLLQQTKAKQEEQSESQFHDCDITSNFSQEMYCAAIQKTIDYIYAGDIFQANITQCFYGEIPTAMTTLQLYTILCQKNAAPFSAFLQFDDVVIASASPERFIKLVNGKVETRPIKGTRPRSLDRVEDERLADELMNSEKDRAENIMIVDLMRNDLSRVSEPHSLIVTQLCGLESYATVHHLVSVIEAKLSVEYDAVDLLMSTFPGGSITGAPKIRAMEIISELEPTNRGVYCGAIGFIGFNGNMDTSIVIRTYVVHGNHIYFQAGGGIVADSTPEEEYDESLTKAQRLRDILQGKVTA